MRGLDIEESYRKLLQWLINALRKIGLNAKYKPPNDIIVNGKKVSGNAQSRKYGAVLQHGTILLRTYKDTMARVLKVSKEKIERVTGIEEELRRGIDRKRIIKLLVESFEKTYNVKLIKGEFTNYERKLINELRKKYSNPKWIYKR
ncbi:MAG: hypothetical protein B6U76_09980 [Desulfurococcales archaeon ex4484_217_2]|nr:MAG: hypothetical protein B6U76_09980 [Desulfurococcales archaeon ex4484_217_2]